MTVKEANKYIEKIDNEVKNLQKLLSLTNDEKRVIEEGANLNTPVVGMVNIAVNCMCAYKNVLKEKIDNAEIT